MRHLAFSSVAIAAATVLLATPAVGQSAGGKHRQRQSAEQKEDAQVRQHRREEAERVYNAAIKSIPDSREKFDPWKGTR